MAPAKKATASHTTPSIIKLKDLTTENEDLPKPRNSITVASRIVPGRTRRVSASSSPTEGAPLSAQPAVPEASMGEISRPQTPASPESVSNGSGRIGADKPGNGANGAPNSKSQAPPVQVVITGAQPASHQETKLHPAYERYSFENSSNLEEITIRQLEEDISAYHHDLDFCHALLDDQDLTPQEMRTLQLRTLDLSHQIRHCKHRIETTQWQIRKTRPANLRPLHAGVGAPLVTMSSSGNGPNGSGSGRSQQPSSNLANSTLPGPHSTDTPLASRPNVMKRESSGLQAGTPVGSSVSTKRRTAASPQEADEGGGGPIKKAKRTASPDEFDFEREEDAAAVNTKLQRLGFWNCRLCSAPKYLLAGSGRTPAMPCKWPLKDISKMITHFTEMHMEHDTSERCAELGHALAKNRGPFEYWLRKTRAQSVGDGSVIDEAIMELQDGKMPVLLRRHSRAAASMTT